MKQELFNKIVAEVTQSVVKTFLKNMIEEDVTGFTKEEMRNLLSSICASITINIINLHKKKIEANLEFLVISTSHYYSILLYEKYLGIGFRNDLSKDLIETEITGIAKKKE